MKAPAPIMGELYLTVAALAPLRAEPSDAAEMVSQLLFGEGVQLLESQRQWRKIKVLADGYEGWVDEKALEAVDAKFLEHAADWAWVASDQLVLGWGRNGSWSQRRLGFGSRIPIQPGQNSCKIGDWELTLPEKGWRFGKADDREGLSAQYLGAPYLWGGKSIWGIDCSGFTQMVFGLTGKQLPRDAWQQEQLGSAVSFEQKQAGDLAFFANANGRVIHVGILLENGEIRHAHGMVRDDLLNPEGIQNKFTGLQTHKLCSIKRIL